MKQSLQWALRRDAWFYYLGDIARESACQLFETASEATELLTH